MWFEAITGHFTFSLIPRYTVIIKRAEDIRQHQPTKRRNLGLFEPVISVTIAEHKKKESNESVKPKIYIHSESIRRNLMRDLNAWT